MIDTLKKSSRNSPYSLDKIDLDKLSGRVLETGSDRKLRAIYLTEDHQEYLNCLEELSSITRVSLDHCNSITWLLRSGHYQSYSIFVLPDESPLVTSEDLFLLLKHRLKLPFRLITGITEINDLKKVLHDACEAINLDMSIDRVVGNYVSEIEEKSPVIRSEANAKDPQISEDEFKEILRTKLRNHLNCPPEDILKEAINTIRKEP